MMEDLDAQNRKFPAQLTEKNGGCAQVLAAGRTAEQNKVERSCFFCRHN